MGNVQQFPVAASRRPRRLMDRVISEIRVRHYSIRTEEAYTAWIRRYIRFHRSHPRDLDGDDLNRFLTHLAEHDRVAVSTQRQAMSAILFLYRHVLKTNFEWLDDVVRARQPRRLPNVLSREEVAAVLSRLEGIPQLVVLLLYGTGMRILECLRLRVQDIDFDLGHITIRRPKGGRDRVTMLPESTRDRLQRPPDQRSALSTNRTSRKASATSTCRTPSPASIPTPTATGNGSTSSRPPAAASIRAPASIAATTSTSRSSERPSTPRLALQPFRRRSAATPFATASRPTS